MSETLKVPTVKMVDGKGKKLICNASDTGIWEAKGYYVEGSKPAPSKPAPSKPKRMMKQQKDESDG
jgi:hypothetical protein